MNIVATRRLTPAVLADHPFFSELPIASLRRLATHVYRVDYVTGDAIIKEGASADRFFLIRRGLVKLDMEVPGRGRVDIETLGADSALGWSWLMSPYRWHLSATAVDRTSVLVFDASALRALLAGDPTLGYEFMRRITTMMFDRLETTRKRLGSASQGRSIRIP
ncbi:MAG: cyclic nucleotide-binding domain-containing protein [Acidothermaceae bacterium]